MTFWNLKKNSRKGTEKNGFMDRSPVTRIKHFLKSRGASI